MGKTTSIITVRHGETEWHRLEKQQRWLDSNLTTLGIQQAEALAQRLREYLIENVFK